MYVCVCVNILLNHSLNNGIKRDGDSLSSTSHSRAVGQPQTEANSMGLNNNIVYVHHQCVCNIQKDQPTERKPISRPPFGTVITFLSVVVSVVHSAEPLGGSEPRKIIKCIYKEKEKNIFLFEKRKEKRENLF